MSIIFKHRQNFTCDQYDNVKSIAYNSETKVYTVIYGSDNTTTYYDGNQFILFIMAN